MRAHRKSPARLDTIGLGASLLIPMMFKRGTIAHMEELLTFQAEYEVRSALYT